MNIKQDIIFYIDTGSNLEVLKKRLLKDGHSLQDINFNLNEMIDQNIITLGSKSKFVVVNEFMPNAAKKLNEESSIVEEDILD